MGTLISVFSVVVVVVSGMKSALRPVCSSDAEWSKSVPALRLNVPVNPFAEHGQQRSSHGDLEAENTVRRGHDATERYWRAMKLTGILVGFAIFGFLVSDVAARWGIGGQPPPSASEESRTSD
ncbi:hypothetical protein MTO96_033858 [Rhipicephalus appendiculatus]